MSWAIITREVDGVIVNVAWCDSVRDAEAYIAYIERTTDPEGVARGDYGVDEMLVGDEP